MPKLSNRRRRLWRVCLPAAACSLAALAASIGGEPPVEERIAALRREARYEAAAALADSLVAARGAAGDSLGAFDARRLAATLHAASAAPESARRRLAEADRAATRVDSLYKRGEYAEAGRLAESQIEARAEVFGARHEEVAISLADLGVIRRNEGRLAEAESVLASAFAIQHELLGDDHPRVAQTLNSQAALHRDQGRYREAAEEWRRALAIRRRHLPADHPSLATTIHNLATVLTDLGEFAEAETLVRESLAIKQRTVGEASPSYAQTLQTLANLHDHLGDRGRAEVLYRRALAIVHTAHGEDHPLVAHARQELGMHLEWQGDHEAARELVEEALAAKRRILGADHPEVAVALGNLAGILDNCGDHAEAERLNRQAYEMRVAQSGVEHPSSVRILSDLGLFKTHSRAHAEAESLFAEALGVARRIYPPDHAEVARLALNLAISRRWLGDYAGAAPLIEEAIAIRTRALGARHPHVANALRHQGHLYLAMGDLDRAAACLAAAADIFESARVRAGSGLARVTFLEPPYTLLAGVELLRGHPQMAWPAVERDRGRALAELLLEADRRALSAEERKAERALARELMDREREYAALNERAMGDSARGRLLDAEARWTVFQREVAARYPVGEGQVFSLERVQKALPPRTAIIGWLDVGIAEDRALAWGYVVRRDRPVSWHRVEDVGSAASDPPEWLERFAETLRDPSSIDASVSEGARRLCEARFAPLESALENIDDLIVVPTGPTAGIPLESLIDSSGEPLGERFAISYVPSCTVFAWLTERSSERATWKRALLVGDPPFSPEDLLEMESEVADAGAAPRRPVSEALLRAPAREPAALSELSRLPGTRREVAAIDSVLASATTLLGAAAREEEIVRRVESGELARFDVIHFATHALVDHRRPERSALVLARVGLPDPEAAAVSGERIIDGLLTAKEVLREWRLDADLVTLSACESGLGKEIGGEGTVGFAHAFFQAGARSVLVSLWRVDDRATSLLMRRFYENATGAYLDTRAGRIASPMPKADALREAKSWLRGYRTASGRQPYAHPSYWSAFVLIGGR